MTPQLETRYVFTITVRIGEVTSAGEIGTGAHQCAGMALARLEGAIAISHFLARFPDYALDGEPVRGGRVRFRGFLSVPCRVS